MIIWIASYPKSGNTLVRAILSAYFYSKNGEFDLNLLRNIPQFPKNSFFKDININPFNEVDVAKNYIKAQKKIITKDTVQFLKTHNSLCTVENHDFTNLSTTIGVIYVIRDPRNVVMSYSNHFNVSIDESYEFMCNGKDLFSTELHTRTYVGSYDFNYNSWKRLNFNNRYLLIKYEDIINDKINVILKILNFIKKHQNTFEINLNKIDKICETTDFQFMQKLEKQTGFNEASINKKTSEKIKFFDKGPKNNYEEYLHTGIKKKIEKKFEKIMLEKNYL